MKLVLQAVIGSIAIHVIFTVGLMVVGYIKTKNYKPNLAEKWDATVVVLQDEVVFGKIISPSFGLLSIMGVAVILGFIIFTLKMGRR
ncbi:hypothetical protein [Sporosarcina sp. FSL K6-3457]|uniref:hypothetical protein n=1 Tax=Sporosarcina sp. FSL K6-3457 TaxID=2978204 RepID=UPI0030F7F7CB